MRKGERKREERRDDKPSPPLVLQATNTGLKRPGHEARNSMYGCGACNGLIDLHLAIG